MSLEGHMMILGGGYIKMKGKKKLGVNLKNPFENQVSKALDLPEEVINDLPVITLVGKGKVSVENFSGLVEYTNERIRLGTSSGIVVIEGTELMAKSMTLELIVIQGNIRGVSFG